MPEQNENTREIPAKSGLSPEDEQLPEKQAGFSPEDLAELLRLLKARAAQALEDKYGEPFTVAAIGDMFGRDRAKVFAHPNGEEALVFTALVYFDGSVKDDYPAGLHLFKTEKALAERLEAAGFRSAVNCVFPAFITDERDTGLSLGDFAEKHGIDRMLCRLIFPSGTEAGNVLPVLEEFSGTLPADLMINGFTLEEDEFKKCREVFSSVPSVSEDSIREHNPTAYFRLFVSKGKGTWIIK